MAADRIRRRSVRLRGHEPAAASRVGTPGRAARLAEHGMRGPTGRRQYYWYNAARGLQAGFRGVY